MQIAQGYAKELEQGNSKLPFKKLVWCNIGNPQILGQAPVTYFRQVLALCEYPQVSSVGGTHPMVAMQQSFFPSHACMQLLEEPQVEKLFPSDVISRARHLLDQIPGGLGAYSDSQVSNRGGGHK